MWWLIRWDGGVHCRDVEADCRDGMAHCRDVEANCRNGMAHCRDVEAHCRDVEAHCGNVVPKNGGGGCLHSGETVPLRIRKSEALIQI